MNDWISMQGRVVIVTGGSSGFGAAICAQLDALGAQVVNADLRPPEDGACGEYVSCDITRQADRERLVAHVWQKYGRLDGLVNNAGTNRPRLLVDVAAPGSPFELNETDYDAIQNLDVKSLVFLTQAVARRMIEQHSGVIVNVSSTCGSRGSFGQSAYAAAKAAVNSLTKSFALELGRCGIRVVAVTPGIHEKTALNSSDAYLDALAYTRGSTRERINAGYESSIPLGRAGALREVADLVCYLLSDRASYITGTVVNVSGGKTTD